MGHLPASILTPQSASATSFSLAPSVYQFAGAGDSLSMLAKQTPKEVLAIAKISMPENSSAAAQGAVVFRSTSSPTSAFVSMGQQQNGALSFQWRPYPGGAVSGYSLPNPRMPLWVKLTKSGSRFEAFYSKDGTSWSYAAQIGASFGIPSYYVGLESLSDSTSGPALTFSGVSTQ